MHFRFSRCNCHSFKSYTLIISSPYFFLCLGWVKRWVSLIIDVLYRLFNRNINKYTYNLLSIMKAHNFLTCNYPKLFTKKFDCPRIQKMFKVQCLALLSVASVNKQSITYWWIIFKRPPYFNFKSVLTLFLQNCVLKAAQIQIH